jgi:hypothetical protein
LSIEHKDGNNDNNCTGLEMTMYLRMLWKPSTAPRLRLSGTEIKRREKDAERILDTL